ncbi:hypothetical protein AAVH_33200, partial [Aphelenchoides avenae]
MLSDDVDETTNTGDGNTVYRVTPRSMQELYEYINDICNLEAHGWQQCYLPKARYDHDMQCFFANFTAGYNRGRGRAINEELVDKYNKQRPLSELDVYDECYVYLYCDPRHIAGWTQEVEYDTFDPIHSKDGVDFVQEYLRGVASCSLDTLAASIFYVGKGRHLRSHEHLEKVSKMCHRFLKTGGPKWPKEVEEMRRWA